MLGVGDRGGGSWGTGEVRGRGGVEEGSCSVGGRGKWVFLVESRPSEIYTSIIRLEEKSPTDVHVR